MSSACRSDKPAGAFDDRVQWLAVDQFHHQVRGAALAVHLGLAVVVHAGDAGVVEHRDRAGLGPEAFDELGVGGVLGLEYLDRDAAAEPGVHAFPHLAHTAGGDQPLQPVATGQRDSDAGAHDRSRNAAAMVARPMGAATAPPVAESLSPPFSTSTATATLGA